MAGRRAGQACLAVTHIVALLSVLFKAKTQGIMIPLILFVRCFSENGCCVAVHADERNDVILAEACRNDVEAYCKDVEPGGCVGGVGEGGIEKTRGVVMMRRHIAGTWSQVCGLCVLGRGCGRGGEERAGGAATLLGRTARTCSQVWRGAAGVGRDLHHLPEVC